MVPTKLTTKESTELDRIVELLGKDYENYVLEIAEKNKDNIFIWATAREMSRDVFMKNYHLQQMIECIRRNGKAGSYSAGIWCLFEERPDIVRALTDEMVKKHPISGRLYKLIFCLYGLDA